MEGTGRRRRAAAHAENGGHRETADLAMIVDPHGSLGGDESRLPPTGGGNGVARKAARRRGNAKGEHQGGGLEKEGKDGMESSFASRRSGRKGISFLSVSMGDDENQPEGDTAAGAEQATHETSRKSNGEKVAANGAGALDAGLSLSNKRKNKMMKMSIVTTDEPADADEGQVAGGGGAGSIASRFKRQYSLATRQSFRPQVIVWGLGFRGSGCGYSLASRQSFRPQVIVWGLGFRGLGCGYSLASRQSFRPQVGVSVDFPLNDFAFRASSIKYLERVDRGKRSTRKSHVERVMRRCVCSDLTSTFAYASWYPCRHCRHHRMSGDISGGERLLRGGGMRGAGRTRMCTCPSTWAW